MLQNRVSPITEYPTTEIDYPGDKLYRGKISPVVRFYPPPYRIKYPHGKDIPHTILATKQVLMSGMNTSIYVNHEDKHA